MQPLLESGHRGVIWEAAGSAGGGAAEDVAAGGGAGCGGDGVVVGNKKSGRQQKRTLGASWDIQLGAKLRSAAKCGAHY